MWRHSQSTDESLQTVGVLSVLNFRGKKGWVGCSLLHHTCCAFHNFLKISPWRRILQQTRGNFDVFLIAKTSILLKTQVLLKFTKIRKIKFFKSLYNETGCTFLTRLQMLNRFCKISKEVKVTNLTSYEKKIMFGTLKPLKICFFVLKVRKNYIW